MTWGTVCGKTQYQYVINGALPELFHYVSQLEVVRVSTTDLSSVFFGFSNPDKPTPKEDASDFTSKLTEIAGADVDFIQKWSIAKQNSPVVFGKLTDKQIASAEASYLKYFTAKTSHLNMTEADFDDIKQSIVELYHIAMEQIIEGEYY